MPAPQDAIAPEHHYQDKDCAIERTEQSAVEARSHLENPDDLARSAQPPIELNGLRVDDAYLTAAGIPAILKTAQAGLGEMGPLRTGKTLVEVNQKHGFDCQSCAWPSPDQHRKVFEFCENGSKAVADEATTRRIGGEFFAKHSVRELAAQSDYWLNAQGRLTEPMILRRGASHYAPVSWELAIEAIAQRLRDLASPNEAAFYTSGKSANEPAFLLQLFARMFGTNNLPDCSNMCHESSGLALTSVLGTGKGTVTLEDFEKCELILIFGNNPGTNHPRMLSSLEAAKRKGAKIIAVNPLPETGLMKVTNPNPQEYPNPLTFPFAIMGGGTPLADLFVPVRINGDIAFLKGVMKYQVQELAAGRESGIDREFIDAYTDGYETFVKDLQATPWNEIVENSGLSVETIEAAARLCIESRRTICCWATGMTQHRNGVANVAYIVNLLLLGGHIGREGAGTCCVRGHSNVQGDRTMGVTERPTATLLDALARELAFSPPREPGFDTVETLHAMHDRRLKVFLAISGNLVSNAPDTVYTANAISRCQLTAYISTKLNRSHLITGEEAIILPCLGRSEIDRQGGVKQFLTVEDSMGIVNASQGVLEPGSPHLRSDVWIIANIALATMGGHPTADWGRLGADCGAVRDLIERVIPGFEGFNERIGRDRFFYLPNAARQRVFHTQTGRAEITTAPLPEHGLAEGELMLTTVRSHDQFNSVIYGLDDRYRGVFGGRRVVFMHPDDIAERGFKAGDLVDLQSRYDGEKRIAPAFALVPYTIPRRCAAAYYPETNVLVPVQNVADRSNQPAYKSIRIFVTRSQSEVATAIRIDNRALAKNLHRPLPSM